MMPPESMEENEKEKLEKYKELYVLSKEVFSEELNRSAKIDDKASKYLTVLTFLLGAFGFFGQRIFDSFIPPKNYFSWLIIIICGMLLFLLLITWFVLFGVLRIHVFRKISIDIDFFDNNELIDVYYASSRGIKNDLILNREQVDNKSRKLYHSYILIRVLVVFLAILSVLFFIHKWLIEVKILNN